MCHLDIRQIRRTEEKTVDLQQLVESTRPDEGWIHRRDLSGYRIIVSTRENRILLPTSPSYLGVSEKRRSILKLIPLILEFYFKTR